MIGRIDAKLSRHLEIGFSGYGPTIGIIGTFHAIHRDFLVSRVGVVIEGPPGFVKLELEMYVFRTMRLAASGSTAPAPEGSIEAASSFVISAAAPHRFNILFASFDSQERLTPTILAAKNAFDAIYRKHSANVLKSNVAPAVAAFIEFLGSDMQRAFPEAILHAFPWIPGNYKLMLLLQTERPSKVFRFHRKFSIGDEDIGRLKANAWTLLSEIAGQQSPYSFVFKKLEQ